MIEINSLKNDLRRDEGFRQFAYIDQSGKLTLGYGRNIDKDGGEGITKQEAEILLSNDIQFFDRSLAVKYDWYANMSPARCNALVNMAFNIGLDGLAEFKEMLYAFSTGDYNKAADEALDSLWAKQVGQRAQRIADNIRKG